MKLTEFVSARFLTQFVSVVVRFAWLVQVGKLVCWVVLQPLQNSPLPAVHPEAGELIPSLGLLLPVEHSSRLILRERDNKT
jgi:hypothetical protein